MVNISGPSSVIQQSSHNPNNNNNNIQAATSTSTVINHKMSVIGGDPNTGVDYQSQDCMQDNALGESKTDEQVMLYCFCERCERLNMIFKCQL
ncbi:unnamed protein product [Anisakis simplex]|uniref:Myb domain-containing protein n=1 Tax=Anisakis simplex TaxID=6269 RepID=A0A0M3JGB9_ANISI|nr:unnamed protein product [Anisakis simplex]